MEKENKTKTSMPEVSEWERDNESPFLTSANVDINTVYIVDRMVKEKATETGEPKWTVYFSNVDKRLTLNNTNRTFVAKSGFNPANISGAKMSFKVIETQFNGQPVDAVRIKEIVAGQ
jgi:hypothetical protein